MGDLGTLTIAGVALLWLWVAWRFTWPAIWFVLLYLPIQGWIQLNVFEDSSATVLLYEFQIIGLYLVVALKALRSPDEFGPPAVMKFAIPIALWVLLLVPRSLALNGVVLTLVGLRTDLLPLPLVWIGYRAFDSRRQLENIGWPLMLQLAFVGSVAAVQFLSLSSGTGTIFEIPTGYTQAGVIRPPGTFSTSAHFGMYILFSIPFAIGLLGLNVPFWKRVCFIIGLGGATVGLMANTQRATVVLLTLTVPLIVLLARRRRAVMHVTIAICAILGGAVIGNQLSGEAFQQRIASITYDLNNTLVLNPVERWNDALRDPVWGGGLGIASPGGNRLEPETAMKIERTENVIIKTPESFMPALVYEAGLPGLVFFYLFVFAILYYELQVLRVLRPTDLGLFAAAIIGFQIAILIQSWAYDPLHYPPSRVLFWFWAGALISLPTLRARSAARRAATVRRMPVVPQRRLVRPLPSGRRTARG
jgi:hypothetical protein